MEESLTEFTNYDLKIPEGKPQERYDEIKKQAKVLAFFIYNLCHDSRSKSLALNNLQQSVMWAKASILKDE